MTRYGAALAAVLGVLLIGGFVVLAALGRDTAGFALFVSGPIVSTVAAAIVAARVDTVKRVADRVAVQTDGLLSQRMDQLDAGMATASRQRTDIAEATVRRENAAGGL